MTRLLERRTDKRQNGRAIMSGNFSAKGQRRRQDLVEAAAEILRHSGPAGVTMRTVARRVGASLSALTYYFDSADELLAAAGRLNISRWAERAERVAEEAESHERPEGREAAIDLILRATLPKHSPLLGHYSQLIAAGASIPVATAYNTGRGRLNLAVGRVLRVLGVGLPAELIIGVVDGAAVTALSEGRDVRDTARRHVALALACCGEYASDSAAKILTENAREAQTTPLKAESDSAEQIDANPAAPPNTSE